MTSTSKSSETVARPNQRGVVTIGHAIVDVLGHSSDSFLATHGLVKGSMELIDESRAVPLYDAMKASCAGDIVTQSGGSAANTAVVAAVLGAPSAFVGKVRTDDLGHAFAEDLKEVNVDFPVRMADDGAPTGRSMINVTPDAERTMCTYLGAARGLRIPDMDSAVFANAAVTYVEGYLWDEPLARPALLEAIRMAHAAGRKSAFTLSDSFLVDRFRDEFRDFLPSQIDILFANDVEVCSMFETEDFDYAAKEIGTWCELVTITRGAKGSVVVANGDIVAVPAEPVARVVDTTGAGDAYAGGFLYGYSEGLPLDRCAQIGNISAGQIISRLGARPSNDLADLIR